MPRIAVYAIFLLLHWSPPTVADTRPGLPVLRSPQVQIYYGEIVRRAPTPGKLSSNHQFLKALNRNFDIELDVNRRLLAALPSRAVARAPADFSLLTGRLRGVANSWVRISQSADEIIGGAIFDGSELFIIDQRKTLTHALAPGMADLLAQPPATPIMFRAADVVTVERCGVEHTAGSAATLDTMLNGLQQDLTGAVSALEELDVTLVTDTAYAASNGGDAMMQLLTQINVVDGIFAGQVNLQLNLFEIVELTSDGPLTATSAQALLDQFRAYSFNNLSNQGVSHLLTGRDLDGDLVGMAFVASVCDPSSAVALSQAGGRGVLGALTIAHEIAHNLGAPHDNEPGSACATTPATYLMNPEIVGSQSFSPCSLDQMSPVVTAARCVASADPATRIINAKFDLGTNRFNYLDDTFRGTVNPVYAKGQYVTHSGGAFLSVKLGGRDNRNIQGISGGWRRHFNLPEPRRLSVSLRFKLVQAAYYEADEFSEAIVALDGQPVVLARLTGDGDGGDRQILGWQKVEADLGFAAAGPHLLTLGGYNNKKTTKDEWTFVRFDDVAVYAR